MGRPLQVLALVLTALAASVREELFHPNLTAR